MATHKKYHLYANEECIISLSFTLMTCFMDGFTLGMKSQSIAYLLSGSKRIYWILGLEVEVHWIWGFVDWVALKNARTTLFESRTIYATFFGRAQKNLLRVAQGLRVASLGPYPIRGAPPTYLLSGSKHIHWILDLEVEVHWIWGVCGLGDLEECTYNFIWKSVGGMQHFFPVGFKKVFLGCPRVAGHVGCGPYPIGEPLPWKARWGCFSVRWPCGPR